MLIYKFVKLIIIQTHATTGKICMRWFSAMMNLYNINMGLI